MYKLLLLVVLCSAYFPKDVSSFGMWPEFDSGDELPLETACHSDYVGKMTVVGLYHVFVSNRNLSRNEPGDYTRVDYGDFNDYYGKMQWEYEVEARFSKLFLNGTTQPSGTRSIYMDTTSLCNHEKFRVNRKYVVMGYHKHGRMYINQCKRRPIFPNTVINGIELYHSTYLDSCPKVYNFTCPQSFIMDSWLISKHQGDAVYDHMKSMMRKGCGLCYAMERDCRTTGRQTIEEAVLFICAPSSPPWMYSTGRCTLRKARYGPPQ